MAILLISPEPWDAHTVSKHHYARTLATLGHRVLFLDPPEPGRKNLTLDPIPVHSGVERVRGPRVAAGLRRMPGSLRRWLEHRWLRRLELLAGCRIEVIWLFENSRFFDLRFARSRLKIYHQVDLNQNFHPGIAARTADICFCTSELIRQRLLSHNVRTYFVQHGTAFPKPDTLDQNQQACLRSSQYKAAYVGNLSIPYLDIVVLKTVVHNHPDVQFHMIGGVDSHCEIYQSLSQEENVKWWGQVGSAAIPDILKHMDILLLCYSQSFREQVSNPHKLMEYLASGRAVVATYTEEYKQHSELLEMSSPGNNACFPELFATILGQLTVYNSPEKMAKRRAFAEDHTYPRQLKRIQALLLRHGFSLPAVSIHSDLP